MYGNTIRPAIVGRKWPTSRIGAGACALFPFPSITRDTWDLAVMEIILCRMRIGMNLIRFKTRGHRRQVYPVLPAAGLPLLPLEEKDTSPAVLHGPMCLMFLPIATNMIRWLIAGNASRISPGRGAGSPWLPV